MFEIRRKQQALAYNGDLTAGVLDGVDRLSAADHLSALQGRLNVLHPTLPLDFCRQGVPDFSANGHSHTLEPPRAAGVSPPLNCGHAAPVFSVYRHDLFSGGFECPGISFPSAFRGAFTFFAPFPPVVAGVAVVVLRHSTWSYSGSRSAISDQSTHPFPSHRVIYLRASVPTAAFSWTAINKAFHRSNVRKPRASWRNIAQEPRTKLSPTLVLLLGCSDEFLAIFVG